MRAWLGSVCGGSIAAALHRCACFSRHSSVVLTFIAAAAPGACARAGAHSGQPRRGRSVRARARGRELLLQLQTCTQGSSDLEGQRDEAGEAAARACFLHVGAVGQDVAEQEDLVVLLLVQRHLQLRHLRLQLLNVISLSVGGRARSRRRGRDAQLASRERRRTGLAGRRAGRHAADAAGSASRRDPGAHMLREQLVQVRLDARPHDAAATAVTYAGPTRSFRVRVACRKLGHVSTPPGSRCEVRGGRCQPTRGSARRA